MSDNPLLDAILELKIGIGDFHRKMTQRDEMQRRAKQMMQPVFAKPVGSVVINASGIGVVNLGGPNPGYFWIVKAIQVGGLSPGTAAAGRADVFVSSTNYANIVTTSTTQCGLQDWSDQAATLPLIANYGDNVLPVQAEELLQIVFSNASSAQTYVARANIVQFMAGAYEMDWTV